MGVVIKENSGRNYRIGSATSRHQRFCQYWYCIFSRSLPIGGNRIPSSLELKNVGTHIRTHTHARIDQLHN